ncbi:MAG: hypothetical protein OQK82_09050 [Candidatus Pacearchaeota archaeon]|nr:hypothetical protein [Candidatus Pacearchaeota archaeon]
MGEIYDIIIIGAGVAGCGISYHLKKVNFKGRLLIIDKKEPGANNAYGGRNTTKEIIKKYSLPYEHIYKGIKVGSEDETLFIFNKEFYFVNYKKICKKLLTYSQVEFRQETGIKLDKNILITNKNHYRFKIIIDCSGKDFFCKKIYKQRLPFRYWIGKTLISEKKIKDKNYFYFQFNDNNNFEDLYPLKNKTLYGTWQYTKKPYMNKINLPKKNLKDTYIKDSKIIKIQKAIIPCTPVFSMRYKNIYFLGDSFGNATTSSAEGIRAILENAKSLANLIKKNELNKYEKIWKKKNFDSYMKFLVPRINEHHNLKFIQNIKKLPSKKEKLKILKKYPDIFEKILMSDSNFKYPKEIEKIFISRQKVFLMYNYLLLKLRYSLINKI